MNENEIRNDVSEALKSLEGSGDIVVVTNTPSEVVNKIVQSLGVNARDYLNEIEFSAVLNSLNVLVHGVKLDNRDFQTVIGVDKEGLKTILDKLSNFGSSSKSANL